MQMGAASSRPPSFSKKLDPSVILNEKEYVFLALQTEFGTAIKRNNRSRLLTIEEEIIRHINDLKSFNNFQRGGKEMTERIQGLICNFEISLAQVRSIFSTLPPKNKLIRNNISTRDKQSFDARTNVADNISKTTKEENEICFEQEKTHNTDDDDSNDIVQINESDYALINFPVSPSSSVINNVDNTYDNRHKDEEYETIESVAQATETLDIDSEPIYMNASNLRHTPVSTEKDVFENIEGLSSNKPPLPIPRNKEEILVKEIPRHFSRLNEILEKDYIDADDIDEVLSIKKKTNDVRLIFMEKIDSCCKRYEQDRSRIKDDTI